MSEWLDEIQAEVLEYPSTAKIVHDYSPEEPPTGIVYLVGCKDSDFVKIGMTRVSVRSRMKGIQTGCPLRLVIIGVIYTTDPSLLESNIHQICRSHRTYGEWFELSEGHLNALFKTLDKDMWVQEMNSGEPKQNLDGFNPPRECSPFNWYDGRNLERIEAGFYGEQRERADV